MAVRPTDPEALHLYQLIGAPLLAVIQAEAQAAQVSADFIRYVGFDKPPAEKPGATEPPAVRPLQEGGDIGALKVAEFRIDRYTADGKPLPHVVRVPVLSLFPIPLMQVKHADFDFDIRVVSRVPLEDPRPGHADQTTNSQTRPDFLDNDRMELKGFLGKSGGGAGEAVNHASIKVRVRLEQSDMPAGLAQLVRLTGENITMAPAALLEEERRAGQ